MKDGKLLVGRLILSAVFLTVLLIAGCQQATPPPPPATATIGDIRATPTAYEERVVTIEGQYQGWKGGYGSPPVTRSDWLVEDATGWLYVTGKPADDLDPLGDVGYPIKVTGQVKLTEEGEPYLVAQEIEVEVTKASALLLLQIDLRKQQLADPIPERLEQMKAMGMRIEELGMQRIFIHLAQEPTAQQLEELEAMGIIPYPDSWIPATGGHPTGFMVADMPIDKLDELAAKDYVVQLDTAEQPLEPQSVP
jgi:hypothetical protein